MPRARPSTPDGDLIDQDIVCPGCGYSLKGLRSSSRCPECGRAIAEKSRGPAFSGDDSLVDAPSGYLRFLALGCILMVLGSLSTLFMLRRAWMLQSQLWTFAAAAAAILWLVGVFIVTEPRRSNRGVSHEARRAWIKTRWTARILHLAWPGAVLAVFIGIRFSLAGLASMNAGLGPGLSGYAPHADAAAGIFVLIGIAAAIPLCIFLTDLAEWARNDQLGERFRAAAWALAFGGLAVIACQAAWGRLGPLNFVAFVGRLFGAVAFVGGLIVFLICLIQLATNALWAIHNAREAELIDERRAEKRARQLERDLAALDAVGAPPPAMSSRTAPGRGQRPGLAPGHGPVRERPNNIEAFDLAPDEGEPPGPR